MQRLEVIKFHFLKKIWCTVLGWAGLSQIRPRTTSSLNKWWLDSEKRLKGKGRSKFLAIFLLVSWMIWCKRNKRVFDKEAKPIQTLIGNIKSEALQWVVASKGRLGLE